MTVFVTRLEMGGNGPTAGIKDTIDIAGVPTRAGSKALEQAGPAAANADVIDGLLAAGYRIAGKTNLHELAFGLTGINAWTGTPINPKYPAYVPGGSSSGSAVAVASGLADVAIGTDTGGSIRVPAACCGVYGFKPTFGRVSRKGVLPARTSLDCVGPMAADMDALIACMRAIDPGFGELPDISAVKIGLLEVDAEADIRNAVEAAVIASGMPGGRLGLDAFVDAYEAGLVIINAETWAACGALVDTGLVGADVATRLMAASKTTQLQIDAAEKVRRAFSAQVDAALDEFDVIALPTLAGAPPLLQFAADTSRLVGMSTLVRPFNLSGHPAITLPVPSRNDFPVGLQLVAAKGNDELLCAVARHIAGQLQQN